MRLIGPPVGASRQREWQKSREATVALLPLAPPIGSPGSSTSPGGKIWRGIVRFVRVDTPTSALWLPAAVLPMPRVALWAPCSRFCLYGRLCRLEHGQAYKRPSPLGEGRISHLAALVTKLQPQRKYTFASAVPSRSFCYLATMFKIFHRFLARGKIAVNVSMTDKGKHFSDVNPYPMEWNIYFIPSMLQKRRITWKVCLPKRLERRR